ncbi:MAG: hypothetical protein ACOC2H_07230, partial [Spirochaetota bacterium]
FQSESESSVTLVNGTVAETALNKKYTDFIHRCGHQNLDVDSIVYDRISFGIKRASVNYYVRPLIIQSDTVKVNSRGSYMYGRGFNMPIAAVIWSENDGVRLRDTVYLRMRGLLDEVQIFCRDDESHGMSPF